MKRVDAPAPGLSVAAVPCSNTKHSNQLSRNRAAQPQSTLTMQFSIDTALPDAVEIIPFRGYKAWRYSFLYRWPRQCCGSLSETRRTGQVCNAQGQCSTPGPASIPTPGSRDLRIPDQFRTTLQTQQFRGQAPSAKRPSPPLFPGEFRKLGTESRVTCDGILCRF
jgi:hypothetical protein